MNTRRRAPGKLVVADDAPGAPDTVQQCELALARWDNEGGARPGGLDGELPSGEAPSATPPLKNAELVRLQVRVIALENLLIALLAEASDQQLHLARDMADYISPRPGFTPHDLTLHAAARMIHLIERAGDFALAERLRKCCSGRS